MDIVIVLAFNDPYVMAAWGKANNQKGEIVSPRPGKAVDLR